jgi:hypothetical protein
LLRRFAPRKKNPPDRNRGEQLKTQAVNRLVEVIQEDWICLSNGYFNPVFFRLRMY